MEKDYWPPRAILKVVEPGPVDGNKLVREVNATLAKRSRNGAVLAGSAAAAMAGMALWNTYRARKVEREHPHFSVKTSARFSITPTMPL
jgi:hypothetical protein